jgi:glycosyltransferase involved in cell wall biosynthesis
VLHGCYEIAGQGMVLALGLRALGCEARSFAYRVDWDGRRPDLVVELDRLPGDLARGAAMLGALVRWGPSFDVFHFHFGTSFLPRLLDLPLLRAWGKPVVFHFHGCEVRRREHMVRAHRLATCTECDPFCRPAQQRWLLEQAARYAGRVFFSTLDLAESVPGGVHLPLAIETDRWEAAATRRPLPDFEKRDGMNGPVVIAHAPTNRLIKGTRHVEAAVEALGAEFPRLELRMIERRPWAAMPELLAECDILVDQLMMGWYGLLAIEGMAEGKAVVSYLRDDFRAGHPDLPVVDAEPSTLVDVLRGLVHDPVRRAELGRRGPAYVRAHHDARVVAETLLGHYRELLRA